MQVSILSIILMAVSAVISIGLPVFLFIIVRKKYNGKILPAIAGAAAFIIFALILERYINLAVLGNTRITENIIAYIFYGAFMAGIFEETARFISFGFLKKKYSGIGTGLSYGIGHGGIEAVLLAGAAMVSNIVYSVIINSGGAETLTGGLREDAAAGMNLVIAALVNAPSYLFLVSGIERVFAIVIQISLSVIVYYSVFAKKKIWLFPLAILIHAAVDIPAVMMQTGLLQSILLVEGIVFLFAVLLAVYTFSLHRKLKGEFLPPPDPDAA